MNKKLQRFTALIVVIVFAIVSLPLSSFAKTNVNVGEKSTSQIQVQGIKTSAIKIAVKQLAKMLRSEAIESVVSFVEKYASKSVGKTIRKYAGTIANKLDDLAAWEDLTLQAIEDQVTGMLAGIGVPYSTAKGVGFVLKLFVKWVLL